MFVFSPGFVMHIVQQKSKEYNTVCEEIPNKNSHSYLDNSCK